MPYRQIKNIYAMSQLRKLEKDKCISFTQLSIRIGKYDRFLKLMCYRVLNQGVARHYCSKDVFAILEEIAKIYDKDISYFIEEDFKASDR